MATTLDPVYDETRFTAALSAIGMKQYEDAVNLLNQITPNSEFYIDARYMLAQAYSGSQNFDEAEQELLGIVNNHSVSRDTWKDSSQLLYRFSSSRVCY